MSDANLCVQYRVVPVTRFIVTRFASEGPEVQGRSEQKGEFPNEETAQAVAYALCKEEHGRLGYALGDDRIKYPQPVLNGRVGGLRTVTAADPYARALVAEDLLPEREPR